MRLVCLMFWCALAAMAQLVPFDQEYVIPKVNPHTTPADLKNGQQLFMAQCARCHGPKGEGGRGAVLAQPHLRHAPDDQALFLVIRDGIKGTEMPAGYAVDTLETWQLAAYIRSLGKMAPGEGAGRCEARPGVVSEQGALRTMPHHRRTGRKPGARTHGDRSEAQRRSLASSGSGSGIDAARGIPGSAGDDQGW